MVIAMLISLLSTLSACLKLNIALFSIYSEIQGRRNNLFLLPLSKTPQRADRRYKPYMCSLFARLTHFFQVFQTNLNQRYKKAGGINKAVSHVSSTKTLLCACSRVHSSVSAACDCCVFKVLRQDRKTSLKRKIFQRETRHSVFWKAFQISRNYFLCHIHLKRGHKAC